MAGTQPLDTDADPAPGLRAVGLVAAGGAVGTLGRHVLDALVGDVAGLPLGILVVNLTGAFLLGVLIEALALRGPDRGRRRDLRLLLGTGVLGGYTTYSLLAADVAGLVLDQRVLAALGYGGVTVVVGGLASWAGVLAARVHGGRR